jgi:hypothetical protein
MKSIIDQKIEFEVLSENDDSVVFKRVLKKNIPAKEKKKREMNLPKVTIHYFDEEDLEELHKIQNQLSEKYVVKEGNVFVISLKAIADFLVK